MPLPARPLYDIRPREEPGSTGDGGRAVLSAAVASASSLDARARLAAVLEELKRAELEQMRTMMDLLRRLRGRLPDATRRGISDALRACDSRAAEFRAEVTSTTPAVDAVSITRMLNMEVAIKRQRVALLTTINGNLTAIQRSSSDAVRAARAETISPGYAGIPPARGGPLPVAPATAPRAGPPGRTATVRAAPSTDPGSASASGGAGTAAPVSPASEQLAQRWHAMFGSSHSADGDATVAVHPGALADVAAALAIPAISKRRENLSNEQKNIFKRWFLEHVDKPYPSESEKEALARAAGTTRERVTNW